MTHYHVGHNMPGYLPDGPVYFAPTKTFAIELLREEKRHVLDTDDTHELRFEGNAVTDLGYRVYLDGELTHLFWADPCTDQTCVELARDQHWY